MNPILAVAIQNLPNIIQLLKDAFKKANPNLPQPTDEEIKAQAVQAIMSSITVDDNWLAIHPEN